jgi:hypothetical protein
MIFSGHEIASGDALVATGSVKPRLAKETER